MTRNPYGLEIPFTDHLGVELVELNREQATIALTPRSEHQNSWGAAHGGIILTLLDVAMSWAARGHYDRIENVVTLDLSAAFVSVGKGKLVATGRVVHAGRTTMLCDAEVKDHAGQLVAKSLGTLKFLREAR